mgnify:CR=1 FL=1
MRLCAILGAVVAAAACSSKRPAEPPPEPAGGRLVFEDKFERSKLGDDWRDTSEGAYRIVEGELRARGARNHPLWLKRELPRDVRVELTARSTSPAVDIKIELFGDGSSHAERASYTATSYVLILGGWNNSRSIIARMNEHGDDRVARTAPRAEPNRRYAFSVTRRGERLTWSLDGEKFLSMEDAQPLVGPSHEHFAFNNWESEVFFDDLAIYAL